MQFAFPFSNTLFEMEILGRTCHSAQPMTFLLSTKHFHKLKFLVKIVKNETMRNMTDEAILEHKSSGNEENEK